MQNVFNAWTSQSLIFISKPARSSEPLKSSPGSHSQSVSCTILAFRFSVSLVSSPTSLWIFATPLESTKAVLCMQPNSCLLPLCHGTVCFPLDSFVSEMLIHEVKVRITVTVAISTDFMLLQLIITNYILMTHATAPRSVCTLAQARPKMSCIHLVVFSLKYTFATYTLTGSQMEGWSSVQHQGSESDGTSHGNHGNTDWRSRNPNRAAQGKAGSCSKPGQQAQEPGLVVPPHLPLPPVCHHSWDSTLPLPGHWASSSETFLDLEKLLPPF